MYTGRDYNIRSLRKIIILLCCHHTSPVTHTLPIRVRVNVSLHTRVVADATVIDTAAVASGTCVRLQIVIFSSGNEHGPFPLLYACCCVCMCACVCMREMRDRERGRGMERGRVKKTQRAIDRERDRDVERDQNSLVELLKSMTVD